MTIVENFDLLSDQEQKTFAKEIISKINTEQAFGPDLVFKLDETSIWADSTTGGINLRVTPEQPLFIKRKAYWQCYDEEVTNEFHWSDAEFQDTLDEAAEAYFRTLTTETDCYKIYLEVLDVERVGEYEIVEYTDVDKSDGGIGYYEYFGATGIDSRPFYEIEGTVGAKCNCLLNFYIEAV